MEDKCLKFCDVKNVFKSMANVTSWFLPFSYTQKKTLLSTSVCPSRSRSYNFTAVKLFQNSVFLAT